MVCRRSDRRDFKSGIADGLPTLRVVERPPHPGGDGEPLAARESADLVEFIVGKEYLQPLTHAMSVKEVRYESINGRREHCQPTQLEIEAPVSVKSVDGNFRER